MSDIPRVLVVEDDIPNQMVAKHLFLKIKCEFEIVGTGHSAIEHVKQNHYDLILMDIGLPDMNGFEATKLIKAFNDTVPIIALTANKGSDIESRCLEAGMNEYLMKPLSLEKAQELLAKYTEKV